MKIKWAVCLGLLFFFSRPADAQILKNLVEFLTIHPNKKAVERDSSKYESKIIISPVVSYSPETSWGGGFGAKYLFKLPGSGHETRTSNLPLSFTYTLENQYIFFSGFEVFTNQEKFVLFGNLIYRQFPQLYYGIGRNTPDSNEEIFSYNQLLFEPLLLKRMIFRYLFVGAGFRYNNISNVDFEDDGMLSDNNRTGEQGSRSVGLEFAMLYDSRDNILTASSGWYAEFAYGSYQKSFGSIGNFSLVRLDVRHFITPFKNRDDILAFQLKNQLSYGDVPILELSMLGSDEIMRGYYEGRYSDNHLIALQTEYRRRIKGAVGMVAFASFGDVASSVGDFNLLNFRPTVGIGFRYLLDPVESLNLRMDWGAGRNTSNFYLNVAEAF